MRHEVVVQLVACEWRRWHTAGVTSPFGKIPREQRLVSDDLAFAVRDLYPISPGHTLVVPHREVAQWWDATEDEHRAIMQMVAEVRAGLLDDRQREQWFPGIPRPDGFNVGFNAGEAAGQTVHHLHVHVIPRYDGDLPDPAGGLRHLIPGKGNYLQAMREATRDETPVDTPTPAERAMATQLESGELIQRVLALLDEGRRTATYKPALLMALVQLAQERADGPGELPLPLADIADRVMQLYWPHTRVYSPTGSVLRQATNPRSRILAALADLRALTGARAATPLSRIEQFYPGDYARARKAVANTLAKQPIPRLQRPGAVSSDATYPRFLYDDSDFRAEASPRSADPIVTLRPGVAQALARSAPLMRIAVEDVWIREVLQINKMQTEEEQLRSFLFGAHRISLTAVATGLRDAGVRTCFWCDRPLGAQTHVDHVIPWSFYASDDLVNLVLTDAACNTDKRDRLVSSPLVRHWQQRDLATLTNLADELSWPMNPERATAVAASAYRYLADGMPLWDGRDRTLVMDGAERTRALSNLQW